MSLLTVCQAAAEEAGLPAPSTVIGNSDTLAAQLLRMANRSGRRLAKRNWVILQKENTFSTVDGTAYYDLPSDFDRLLDETAWDRTDYWSMRGPLSPWQWQSVKSGLVAQPATRLRFRIKPLTRVNEFYIDPTPTSVLSMVFEYASNQWVKDLTNANGKTAYAVDTDISLISEELIELDMIWRLLNAKGLPYEEQYEEAQAAINQAFADDGGAPVLNMGMQRVTRPERIMVPEGNFGT